MPVILTMNDHGQDPAAAAFPQSVQDLHGKIIALRNNCPKDNGWFSGTFQPDVGPSFQLVGKVKPLAYVGMGLTVTGRMNVHPRYGRQIEIDGYSADLLVGENLVSFLSSDLFPGIGRATAQRLVNTFKDDTIQTCAYHPETVKRRLGLSDKLVEVLSQKCREHQRTATLVGTFAHMTLNMAEAISRHAAYRAVSVDGLIKRIKDDPYRLLEDITYDRYVTFKSVDAIATQDLRMQKLDPGRIRACVHYAVKTVCAGGVPIGDPRERLSGHGMDSVLFTGGNSYADLSDPAQYNAVLIVAGQCVDDPGFTPAMFADQVQADGTRIVLDRGPNGHMRAYPSEAYLDTKRAADVLARAALAPYVPMSAQTVQYCVDKWELINQPLDWSQELAVKNCQTHRISILTGGPGYGKTTVLKCIVDVRSDIDLHVTKAAKQILCLAPTGIALKRMKDVIGVRPGVEFQTTASAMMAAQHLYAKSHSEKTKYGDATPWDAQVAASKGMLVILDEASMQNIHQISWAMAQYANADFVFVGDFDQLPSIEHSEFFRDLLTAGIASVNRLSICHRTTNRVLTENAEIVRDGCRDKLKFVPGTWEFDYQPNEDQFLVESILYHYDRLLSAGADFRQIITLSPMKGHVGGVRNLNVVLQDRLNPERVQNPCRTTLPDGADRYEGRGYPISDSSYFGMDDTRTHLRIGDRVVYSVNDYGLGMFNGDTGTIAALVRHKQGTEDFDRTPAHIVVSLDDGRSVSVPKSSWDHLQLAYALTVHKCQGSEYDHVIFVATERLMRTPGDFANRNLLYTGITRAQKSVKVIGSMAALESCAKKERYDRNCALGDMISARTGIPIVR